VEKDVLEKYIEAGKIAAQVLEYGCSLVKKDVPIVKKAFSEAGIKTAIGIGFIDHDNSNRCGIVVYVMDKNKPKKDRNRTPRNRDQGIDGLIQGFDKIRSDSCQRLRPHDLLLL